MDEQSQHFKTIFYPSAGDQGEGPWPIGGELHVAIWQKLSPDGWREETVEQFARSNLTEKDLFRADGKGRWLVSSKEYWHAESCRAVVYIWRVLTIVSEKTLAVTTFVFSAIDMYYDKPGDIYYGGIEMLEREVAAASILAF